MNRTDPRKIVPIVALIVLAAVGIGLVARLGFDNKTDSPVEQVLSGTYDQKEANATVMSGASQSSPTPDASAAEKREPQTQGREAPKNGDER